MLLYLNIKFIVLNSKPLLQESPGQDSSTDDICEIYDTYNV